MEYVHKQTINFRDDRTPLQRRVSIGYEGDNLVERLEFVLPELVGGQTATLMITGADAVTLNRIDDGRYAVDLTREMIGPDGKRDAYVRIDGVSGQIWQSAPLRIVTGKLPDVEEEIEKVYPTAVGQMLTAMAEHTGEMEAQEERVERAAQRAEDAAERAETGGGSGGPGEDGGYYQPAVTDGVLTWTPSKADMPGVPASDVRGPAGQDGQPGKDGADGAPGLPGKTAYQYAQDGGYTGTEAEFTEKLAEEIPEAYTLPTASETIKGGVKVGKGLVMDGEALNVSGGFDESVPEELFSVTLAETVGMVKAPLKRPAKHMVVLVYPPIDTNSLFLVYVYAKNITNIETNEIGALAITDGVNVKMSEDDARFICKIDSDGGLISAYWGAVPSNFQSAQNGYKFLNKPLSILDPAGIGELEIKSHVAGYELPAGATIKVVGA